MLLVMVFLMGFIYPMSVTLVAQVLFPYKANGSLLIKDHHVIGSELLSQETHSDKYFWPRPSSVQYATVPSGASQLGWTARALREQIQARKNLGFTDEMLFSSGSGLDPHLSLKTFKKQISRVVTARQLLESQKQQLNKIILDNVEKRTFLGEERVNVLKINILMDQELNVPQ